MKLLLIATLLLSAVSVSAYIPSADFIVNKAVKNAGSGIYQVRKEIVFANQARPVTVTEHWWIQNDDLMFLKAESPAFTQYFLYKGGKRYVFNSQKSMQATNLAEDFYMPLFFQRNPQGFKETLIRKKLAPAQTFKRRPTVRNAKDAHAIGQLQEPYLKLSRVKNTSSYLLGFASQSEEGAGIWLEQNQFTIKKIKFEDSAELNVDQHAELSKGLTTPKTYAVIWGGQTAQVELSQGNSIANGSTFFNENEFSKLSQQVKPIPEDYTSVIEFYKKFR